MKTRKIIISLISIFFLNQALAQYEVDELPPISIHRISFDLALNGGKFFLDGNPNGNELLLGSTSRTTNSTKSNSIGVGFSLNYHLMPYLDFKWDWNYEYCDEPLVETYALVSKNYGLKYQLYDWKNLLPFVKLSYTTYTVGEIQVYDASITKHSVTNLREYLFTGKGITPGFGFDLNIGERLTYALGYDRLITTGKLQKTQGGVEFVNKPKHGRFYFAFRVRV